MLDARSIKVSGVVQGVGFRPFVFRLAQANALAGWVLNMGEGVEIFLEGAEQGLEAFVYSLATEPPPAARISKIDVLRSSPVGLTEFVIRKSQAAAQPSARISPDLPVCQDCLRELFDPRDPRYHYPYINCTNCGPRYSLILQLPYDRQNTTMAGWPLDDRCAVEYHDPANRRFHAQPVACPECGPAYSLRVDNTIVRGNEASIREAAKLLRDGAIVAVKGLGGYHLACDARNPEAVAALRMRKYRKEKPFAIMARDFDLAGEVVELSEEASRLLTSAARPIVIAPAKENFEGVAPDQNELGVMLPYAPVHHLLFAYGAPEILVMTSANRSSEPIVYQDDEAMKELSGIADAFLAGERPIVRRVDDSVARMSCFGMTIIRRSRGYAPGAVCALPVKRPILAVGADLKNTVALVVAGQAFVSQHIGDLDHFDCRRAFEQTIQDLAGIYGVRWEDLVVVHDAHPEYVSTVEAQNLTAAQTIAVQHHRAHVASVLAERGEWGKRVLGVSFDGTGYGDDGSTWGGEFFAGSVEEGFDRVAHLRTATLAGGDAAARFPVQAAAGFLAEFDGLPELSAPPFNFPSLYQRAQQLLSKHIRTFTTTSVGRLFDAAAALLGFTREITFEGQAAMWLESLARKADLGESYPLPFGHGILDFRPLLRAVVEDRARGRDPAIIARSFQRGLARGVCDAICSLCQTRGTDTVVLSGGVFQNELLLEDLKTLLESEHLNIWVNHFVPANDGGISLGQAALAAFAPN